jgi:hypothetical protein
MREVDRFSAEITPFLPLYKEIHFSCLAMKVKARWIVLRARLQLTHLPLQGRTFVDVGNLAGFKVSVRTDQWDLILKDVLDNGVIRGEHFQRDFDLYLNLAYADMAPLTSSPSFSFSRSHEQSRSFQMNELVMRLAAGLDRPYDLPLREDDIKSASTKLRNCDPPINGWAGLTALLGFSEFKISNNAEIEFIAGLPFGMSWEDPNLTIEALPDSLSSIRILAFFEPDGTETITPIPVESEGRIAQLCTATLKWPNLSVNAAAHLLFNDVEVGVINVNRWRGTKRWEHIVEDYFSDGGPNLEDAFKSRVDSQKFELGITRLLNLLGVRTIWYGGGDYKEKPDIASLMEIDGKRIILLCECTGQKPANKYTPLMARERRLRQNAGDGVTVIAIVFTPEVVSAADRELASKDGIALIGEVEINRIYEGYKLGWKPRDFLSMLDRLTNTFPSLRRFI